MLAMADYARRMALSRLAGSKTLEETADDVTILCPPEERETPPAVALPGQLDKVIGVHPESTLELQMKRISSGLHRHDATRAFHFRKAALIGGSLFAGSFRYRIASPKKEMFALEPRAIDRGGVVNSVVGMTYFGHWLQDDALTYELACKIGAPVAMKPPVWEETRNVYARAFEQDWTPCGPIYAKELIVYADYAQNSLKLERYRLLRGRLRKIYGDENHEKRVFLRRGRTGVIRVFENEDAIAERLAARGFLVADVENDDIETLLRILCGAKLVVSVEGSHMSHCAYSLADGGGVVSLQPPTRFDNIQKGWIDTLGCHYGFVVCDAGAEGFRVDPDDLDRTIDLMP